MMETGNGTGAFGHNPHGMRSEMRHGSSNDTDPFKTYDEHNQWSRGGSAAKKRPKKYLLWSQLQEMGDRLHFLYSEMTDRSAFDVATITQAEFDDTPLRFMQTVGWFVGLFVLGYVLAVAAVMFEAPYLFVGLLYLPYYFSTMIYPLYIIHRMRRYVVGKERTGKFYKGIKRVWNTGGVMIVMLMVLFYFVSVHDFSFVQDYLINYAGPGYVYVNAVEVWFIQISMLYTLYGAVGFYLVYLFLGALFKGHAKKMQRLYFLELEKNNRTTGEISGDIMRNKFKDL